MIDLILKTKKGERVWTYGELSDTLNHVLRRAGLDSEVEQLGGVLTPQDAPLPLPSGGFGWWRLRTFVEPGANEGHYLQVDLATHDKDDPGCRHQMLLCAKSFCGLDVVLRAQNEISKALYSWGPEYTFKAPVHGIRVSPFLKELSKGVSPRSDIKNLPWMINNLAYELTPDDLKVDIDLRVCGHWRPVHGGLQPGDVVDGLRIGTSVIQEVFDADNPISTREEFADEFHRIYSHHTQTLTDRATRENIMDDVGVRVDRVSEALRNVLESIDEFDGLSEEQQLYLHTSVDNLKSSTPAIVNALRARALGKDEGFHFPLQMFRSYKELAEDLESKTQQMVVDGAAIGDIATYVGVAVGNARDAYEIVFRYVLGPSDQASSAREKQNFGISPGV